MNRHTKIVATLGPTSEDQKTLNRLVQAGMNIARLNCSHGSYEQFEGMVKKIRSIERKTGKTILTLLDLQGPKIRLGEIPAEGIPVKRGEILNFWTGKTLKNGRIPIPYSPLCKILKAGERLLIEDGIIRTKIVSIKGGEIHAKVEVGGTLKRHKGVNIPDSTLPQSEAINAKDYADLRFGIQKLKVDAIALSFVEKAEDLTRVREKIAQWTQRKVILIAKIERPKALSHLAEIAEVADGLMVARGDLGIEIPSEQVPLEQRRIIAIARELGKPVIVATQVLESMVDSPLPTRAETSDAATAVFEQADAFMLSNESAVGQYPVEAVQTLARIAEVTEIAIQKETLWMNPIHLNPRSGDFHDARLAQEAVELAKDIKAQAIVVATHHGTTARAVLRLRPDLPVFVLSNNEDTLRQLHFYWGVESFYKIKAPFSSKTAQTILKKKTKLKGTVAYLSLQDKHHTLVVMDI